MKINKENMKVLAEAIDNNKLIAEYTEDDVMSMAYQLQYFFEAREEIEMKSYGSKKGRNGETLLVVRNTGMYMALDLLNNAIVDKEE